MITCFIDSEAGSRLWLHRRQWGPAENGDTVAWLDNRSAFERLNGLPGAGRLILTPAIGSSARGLALHLLTLLAHDFFTALLGFLEELVPVVINVLFVEIFDVDHGGLR